jgi:hypothetical protein
MCMTEQNHYSACNHFVREYYDCPYQKDIHRFDSDWLSECSMQVMEKPREEVGLCGRCDPEPRTLTRNTELDDSDGNTFIPEGSLQGDGMYTRSAPDGAYNPTSLLSTGDESVHLLPTPQLSTVSSLQNPSPAYQALLAILLTQSVRIDNTINSGNIPRLQSFRMRSGGPLALSGSSFIHQGSLYYTVRPATGLVYMFPHGGRRVRFGDALDMPFSLARGIRKTVTAGILRVFQ